MIIILKVPLAIDELAAPMSIWQVHTFSLLSLNQKAYYTKYTIKFQSKNYLN